MTQRYRGVAGATLVAAIGLLASTCANAEGGPPLLTDDPGTVDPGHWEINLAWTAERSADAKYDEAPLADINYGLNDTTQLKFEMPWVVETGRGTNGFGAALVGVKWRFVDQGERGWQVSTYPQAAFLPPGLHHAASAESGVAWLLPLEVQRDFGAFDAGFEVGRTLAHAGDGWVAGVDVGRKVCGRWELLGELHDEGTEGEGHELVFDVGARATLSEHFTLLASIGTDVENTGGPRNEWLSYLALQLSL
jgi:hypothetical protein